MDSLVCSCAGRTACLPSHETCQEPAPEEVEDGREISSSSHSIIRILVPSLAFPASNSKRASAVIERDVVVVARGVSRAEKSVSGVNVGGVEWEFDVELECG